MTTHTNLKKNLKYRFQSIEIWAPSWCNSGTAFSPDPTQAVWAAVWAPVEAASVPLDLKSHLRLAGHDVEGSAAGNSPGDRARRSSLQVNWRGRGIRRWRRRDGRVRFAKSFRSATELGARTAHLAGRGRRARRAGDRRPSRQMLVAPTAPAKWDFSARPFVRPSVRSRCTKTFTARFYYARPTHVADGFANDGCWIWMKERVTTAIRANLLPDAKRVSGGAENAGAKIQELMNKISQPKITTVMFHMNSQKYFRTVATCKWLSN